MNAKYVTLSLISLFVAAACSPREEPKTEKKADAQNSVCRHPNVPTQLHDDLQAAILAATQKYIQNDPHQFVDADKISAAANQLKLNINGIQDKEGQCRGKVSILIPQSIQKVAQTYAPLVGIKQYDTIIEEGMGNANFQFNGSTLTLPINFTVSGEPIQVKQSDDAFQIAATALSTALLPYGVKDNIPVAGREMTRDIALQAVKMNGGKLPVAPAPRPETTKAPTETQQPENTSNNTNNNTVTQPAATPPKVVQNTPPKPAESAEQKALREARAAEAAAKLAAEKAAQRAAKAKAAREAAEAEKLKAVETARAKAAAAKAAAEAKAKTETKPESKVDNKDTASLTPKATSPNNLTPKRPTETASNNDSKSENLTPAAPKSRVSDDDMDNVRKAHRQADQEIKSSWKKISPDIQKELVEEQKSWEKQRNQRCRQAASSGRDESEANKLYMQCDTRMTKERVKNLEGYSIQ